MSRAEHEVVPKAGFRSYYGRRILQEVVWEPYVPSYFFLGGFAAGSSLLAAGADLTDRPTLRACSGWAALTGVAAGTACLVADLGRPQRFVNMLRVVRPTSPMSLGSWLLAAYGPLAGVAAVAPSVPFLRWAARPAGLAAATLSPAVATYTAVLTADTAVPAWHEARQELPFVYAGGAATAAGGLAMLACPTAEAAPARRLAIGGALGELVASTVMERRTGQVGEAYRKGAAGRWMKVSRGLTAGGAALAAIAGRRSRAAAGIAGAALVVGSLCSRLGVYAAGKASAAEPAHVVVPQRERLAERSSA